MKKIKILFISIIIINVVSFVGVYSYKFIATYYNKKFYQSIKGSPQVYLYDNFYSAPNPAVFIKDLKDSAKLIQYYKKREARVRQITLNFDYEYGFMPFPTTVYIIDWIGKDSMLAHVVDFDTLCWGYIESYVFYKTVHKMLLSDSLLLKCMGEVDSLESSGRPYRKMSPYGFLCK